MVLYFNNQSFFFMLQYNYGGWMPNTPISLQQPPLTTKGQSTESTMLEKVSTTSQGLSTMWLLSKKITHFVPLGDYPEEQFPEKNPLEKIKDLLKELKVFNYKIKARNVGLALPYTYLNPENVENCVAI
uniref:Lipoxygenase domain-containing protein n=1 Tax=Hucho hucho TaxID=62062 RepID=A0A4W5PJH5_9TELE